MAKAPTGAPGGGRTGRPQTFKPGNAYRFKPGQSGNPGGKQSVAAKVAMLASDDLAERAKAEKSLLTSAIRKFLSDPALRNALVAKWIVAAQTKADFARLIIERIEGKVPQTVAVAGYDSNTESPTSLRIEIVTDAAVAAALHDADHSDVPD